ncbi:unnamed protein product [Phyllotreta striolata]|uniref:DNA topoisomerase 2 n=1 Tax=Phyllotreta striolata TaxID=444603 RepID=A0A9N9XK59_PHYSR|nr:unnamed protein product [Phyllotreta striolata]
MADIRNFISKMANGSASKDDENEESVAPQPPKKKAGTIEKTYQKKTQLEHILLRPDTYIGSVEKATELMWIYDIENEVMVQKQIEYVPGLYKIFDEILVNAADNKQRDKSMDCIKIEIKPEENFVSVWNNGKGIPVVMHKDENMFVPTMIFGHLLTSSNYNDEEEKVTGGRNGYGAKLCNIFSEKFIVETASKEYKKQFRQTWGSNMSKTSEPKIKPSNEDYTKISFWPDLSKFKMDKLDDDIVGLMSRRAFDVAASTKGVKVFLNGKRVPVKNFKDYIDLYIKGKEDEAGNPLKIVHEQSSERWEIGFTLSDKGFQQVSFVNSIATTKGGRHVDYIVDLIVKQLTEVLKKKNKGGLQIKPFQIKNHMWIFINCLIVNPTFDSQTKENMTLTMKNFGSKCALSDKFINSLLKCGIVDAVLSWAKFKAQKELNKVSGKKVTKLKGVPKLEDANEAGQKNALKCTLILTEGDSAKGMVMSGLSVVGRDYYGVFPLRGKILNTREANTKQILENNEINNIIKILGLQYKKKYNTDEDMKTLRYGKVMLMTDQDQDGSHIKGLLINFMHHNWPELLKRNFIEQFITPIVKARKNNECLSFYSLPELEEWKANTPNYNTYNIKYYKGLGTSDDVESKEYFANLDRHRVKFKYSGQQDDDHILLAFSKKCVDRRKEWLTNFMVESRRRKEIGLPEKYLYGKDTKVVTFTDFINLELVLFSNGDNIRSIPSAIDGFKPAQRKIMFVAFKRNDKQEVKVSQLVGSVVEKAAYHHADTSLAGTIVGLAQRFIGSNNINLLEPKGQFGTRLSGGKDAASARYIFTKLSPITRMIFHPNDDPILNYEYDDNLRVEPTWYIPILPMVLVNGAEGIGTGWMTKIPNYNPRDIVKNLRRMLDGEEAEELTPWYRNFKGTIEYCGDNRYVVNGEISYINDDTLEITELPVHTWTGPYKENVLEAMLHGTDKVKSVLADYRDYSTDKTVKFKIQVTRENLENLEKEGLHKAFKLQSIINLSSMCAFDEYGCLKKYESVMTLLEDFYALRLKMYEKRKDYLVGTLEAEANKLSAQARFILEKCSGELVVENKKRKIIVDELIKRGYPADPVMEWKKRAKTEEENDGQNNQENDERTNSEVKFYDYLLGMSMWSLTEERKNELLRQRDNKIMELNTLKKPHPRTYGGTIWTGSSKNSIKSRRKTPQSTKKNRYKGKKRNLKENHSQGLVQGKKKFNFADILPSPAGKRVAPTISEDLKKKIQSAVKAKAKAKSKLFKTENSIAEEMDEFDEMVKSKKTLKDKLGTPEEVARKAEKKASKKGDGMKQTKIDFSKANNGTKKPKNKKKFASDDDDSLDSNGSDVEFVATSSSPASKYRPLRKAAATVSKYISSGEDDNFTDKEDELFENSGVKEASIVQNVLESSDDEKKSPTRHETSEDMFDSLVGRKKDESSASQQNDSKKRKNSFSDSDSEFGAIKSKAKTYSSDDSDFDGKKPKEKKAAKKPKATKKKTEEPVKKKLKAFTSDEDEDKEAAAPKKSKPKKAKANNSSPKKGKGKKKSSDTSDDNFVIDDDSMKSGSNSDSPVKRPARPGRGAKKITYIQDSDESS